MKVRMLSLVCAALVLAGPGLADSSSTLTAQKRTPIVSVHVRTSSATASDGFTDPNQEHTDSANDIGKLLASSRRKGVQLAASEGQAHVILEVVERHMEDAGETHVITVRVRVGDVSRSIVARSDSNWRDAAFNVVKQVEAWVSDNRQRILAKN